MNPPPAPAARVAVVAACALLLSVAPGFGADAFIERAASAALAGFDGPVPALLRAQPEYYREGLDATPSTAFAYAGIAGVDAAGPASEALAAQVALLRALFAAGPSPYLVYRLGVLSRTLIEAASPLPSWGPPDREEARARFLADIAAHPDDVAVSPPPPRLLANPAAAIKGALERSAGWAGPVRAQYLSGRGYNVIVRQAAAGSVRDAASLMRNALATVGTPRKARVTPSARDGFHRDACTFYLRRGMRDDAAAAYRLIAGDAAPPRIDSTEAAMEQYASVREHEALEKLMAAAGIEIRSPASEKQKALFLTALSALARSSIEQGRTDRARIVLGLLLREGYRSDWTLSRLGALYGLDELRDLDVPENAWKVYREANRLEAAAGNARFEKKRFASYDFLMRAAALYAAIPEGASGLRKMGQARIAQIVETLQGIPPDALVSEELFQSAVDAIAGGDVDAASRALAVSEHWAPGDRTVRGAAREAEAIRLFAKGRELYEAGDLEGAAKQFRAVAERHAKSTMAAQAGRMLDLYAQRKAQQRGALLLLLRGAYEASFTGDAKSVYARCDEILDADPDDDLQDRAQLLIALTWYETSQRGYQRIDRIFRDLLKHRVLEIDGADLVLKKKIAFYFGLTDEFPGMEIARLRGSLADKLNLRAAARGDDRGGDAQDLLDQARDEIEVASDLIDRGEGEQVDMSEARDLLEKAQDLVGDAEGFVEAEASEEANNAAQEALETATAAREEAEKLLGISGELREEAEKEIEEAENAITEAENSVQETEDELEEEFDTLRSDLDEARDLMAEARDHFDRAEYEEAKEKATETIERAGKVVDDAEEQLKVGQEEAEEAEEWVEE